MKGKRKVLKILTNNTRKLPLKHLGKQFYELNALK
jgi:hypothetical protein